MDATACIWRAEGSLRESFSLLLPCGFKRLNSGQHVWQPEPLTAEPSYWIYDDNFKENVYFVLVFSPILFSFFLPYSPIFLSHLGADSDAHGCDRKREEPKMVAEANKNKPRSLPLGPRALDL